MFSNSCFSGISLLGSAYAVFGRKTTCVIFVFLVDHIRKYMMSVCIITGDATLDPLVKMAFTRIHHCKVVIVPLVN